MLQYDRSLPNETAEAGTLSARRAGSARAMRRVLGLCLGASTISLVQLEGAPQRSAGNDPDRPKPRIVGRSLHVHEGNPKDTLLAAVARLELGSFDRIAVTGRRFRKFINLTTIPEPQAVEYAYRFVKPPEVDCPAIVSAGGETTMVYVLDREGRIANVITGNKCAAGTGEFFLQQIRRMNVSLDTAAQWAASESPHHVSGRCSVFCKSDCTHATNKGIPKSKVTAGLCKMMAGKILELLKKIELRDIMLTGGTAQNGMMVAYLRQEIRNLIVPREAPYFEALGAALWALDNETLPLSKTADLFSTEVKSFDTLAPLADFRDRVTFKDMETGKVAAGDDCVLGLDVGSTTTKAVLVRKRDDAMLASVYLRTDGDPVGAARKCYRNILKQIQKRIDPAGITISGLGVCGSGRQIAGLHAMTDGVINEIVAHATAAVYFDPDVDTIFEIGGQDAKYTYITSAVPSDYAMNEACSAGTGSFLEESAFETLGVRLEDIAAMAMRGTRPPNFNDQCAAFIASDIKNAIHENIEHADIVAGLVYSICMNYTNRVKGNRPVGAKIFMQGGVCYNRAVPLAMAALVGKPIIVPPEPGLMGAFGVALEVKKRIRLGLLQEGLFDLEKLAEREVNYRKPFTCRGGKEMCDRRCEIAVIEIEEKRYPFGGACNRYYNLRSNIRHDTEKLDLVRKRQRLVFEKYGAGRPAATATRRNRGRVGLNRSFLVNTYFPLYAAFFRELGFEPVLPDTASPEGAYHKNAPFCYPAELAHGFFAELLNREDPPEYIFLPHFKAIPAQAGYTNSQVCPIVQGETYFLQAAFGRRISALREKGVRLLSPVIDMTGGLEQARESLVATAIQMGVDRSEAGRAFVRACRHQAACASEMKAIGRQVLAELAADPAAIAVVLFARPYNGFVEEAHMGIPHKIASRGIRVLPFDFLEFDDEKGKEHMFWGMGQLLLKAARIVRGHPQLFGTYITNFSCGPDSFLLGYFREIMGRKPSLTLELDSHTADAGLETRVEAFLDIVAAYRQLLAQKKFVSGSRSFLPARTMMDNGKPHIVNSAGRKVAMTDPDVTLLFPSMGRLSTEAVAAVFEGRGFRVVVHPPSDEAVLKTGRANTSCKECLPLILTTGILLNYCHNGKRPDEIVVYFMPTGSGPCRFGQYCIFMEDLIRRIELPNVAVFSLTSENGYLGMGTGFQRRGWWAIVVADVMEDVQSMLLANARDADSALVVLEEQWQEILAVLREGDFARLEKQLTRTSRRLRSIPLRMDPAEVPKISLTGEIFVRRDCLSRQYLTERLAEKGFASICSPVSEWLLYSDFLLDRGLSDYRMSRLEKIEFIFKRNTMTRYERRIKSILSGSGLVQAEPVDIGRIIQKASAHISPNLGGEAILTVGSALSEIATHTCGVIAIGPFGCMPNRLAEAILNETMNRRAKPAIKSGRRLPSADLSDIEAFPFLAIESDGSPFPQLIEAKLESFYLRAQRLHQRMRAARR